MRRPLHRVLLARVPAGAAVACALAASAAYAPAASTTTVVTMTVPSATEMVATGCSGAAISFGVVAPDTPAVTSADCTISFGSSNDTASLRLRQLDGIGKAMSKPTDGTLESAFGGGKVVTPVSGGVDMPRGMAVQADGMVVIAGTAAGATNDDFGMVRLRSDGTPDPLFGGGSGKVIRPIGTSADTGYAVAIQPDQKIVVVGSGGASGNLAVARFLSDGNYDNSFNGNGRNVQVAGTGAFQAAMAVALQPDGKIVTAGYADPGGATGTDVLVARFNADGSLDTTFGAGGMRYIAVSTGQDVGRGVAIAPDGKIVVTGRVVGATRSDFLTIRLTAAGNLDTTFNGTGINRHQPGADDYGRSVAVQHDGTIVAVGYAGNGTDADMVAVRYLDNGTPDPAFGVSGVKLISSVGADEAYAVLPQGDGRIYLGGVMTTGGVQKYAIARLLANGNLDPTFNGGAALPITVGTGASQIAAMGFGIDGDVYAAGLANGTDNDFAAVRLRAQSIDDYAMGSRDFTGAGSMFGACLRAVANGGATDGTTWTPAACTAASGTQWRAVPGDSVGAKVATAGVSGTRTATASLRFALRPAAAQTPGNYIAPLVFEVLAPAA